MSDREFKNPFPDYDGTEIFNLETGQLIPAIEEVLVKGIDNLLGLFERRLPKEIDWSDTSVYTGTAGLALLYIRFMDCKQYEGKQDFLKEALSIMETTMEKVKKKKITFLCGITGPLAIASVLYQRVGDKSNSHSCARRIECMGPEAYTLNSDLPDEVLFGRAGYLYSLLYLDKHKIEDEFRDHTMKEVVSAILTSGQENACKKKNVHKMPLYYEWHDKAYVGSAHGFAGILYMLLQANEYLSKEQIDEFVRPTIDRILSLEFPSGNYPSSLENSTDRLVHWCHGAPGVIHLFLLAYQMFHDDKYLSASRRCSDVIWERGLLKKGYGLCHGAAGNGYAHLRLFQVTKEVKYLYRAVKFAEWCCDYGKHNCRVADRPLSLFEGLAGTIYYLLDVLNPLQSAFPAFQCF